MCNTCGCNITEGNRHLLFTVPPKKASTAQSIFNSLTKHNDEQAEKNRRRLDGHGVLAINLMSSPGSGKTALLEATIRALKPRIRMAVIEGDLETENDAERIRAQGVAAHQITTGTACHLDAHLVQKALDHLDLTELDLLFIENVGNLVCPASFDLGHHRNVTLLSVTEGDDKPAKYPVMFRAADMMLITKTDLLAVLDDFSVEKAKRCQRALASDAPIVPLSAHSGAGLDAWFGWLETELARHAERLRQHQTIHPRIQKDGPVLHGQVPEVRFRPVTSSPTS